LARDIGLTKYLQPVSDDAPSGPDLELAGDGDFFNYTLPAESRLPTQYLDATGKIVFDRSTINLKSAKSPRCWSAAAICAFCRCWRNLVPQTCPWMFLRNRSP
jgi:hypothetical protein